MNKDIKNPIKIWLVIGLIMVFFQIIIGGITRLTGSGLSITKWDIVTGTIPPLTQDAWMTEFELYKETPQYAKINEGMSLKQFKSIFFWEYFHRLWARTLGFVFIIPLIFFLFKRWVKPKLLKSLGILVVMGILVAVFGWIMVKSGLVDRPWVSAYKLAMHLFLAMIVYGYLLIIYLKYIGRVNVVRQDVLRRYSNIFIIMVLIQIIFGAFMSGMHAGLLYPTWPKIGIEWIPSQLFNLVNYEHVNFWNYDENTFLKLVVQFIHRSLGYILFFFGIFVFWKTKGLCSSSMLKRESLVLITLLISQVIIGIITILSCKGNIPVFLGSLHQATAILLLTVAISYRMLILNKQ